MTIQDWGAVGEIVGAIAVVASLLYLSIQIKSSNRAAHQAEIDGLLNSGLNPLYHISSDAETTELWVKGNLNYSSLTSAQQARYGYLMFLVVMGWHRLWVSHQEGNLPEYWWEGNTATRQSLIAGTGFKAWFENTSHILPKNFSDFLESEMKQSTTSYKPLGLNEIEADQADT